MPVLLLQRGRQDGDDLAELSGRVKYLCDYVCILKWPVWRFRSRLAFYSGLTGMRNFAEAAQKITGD